MKKTIQTPEPRTKEVNEVGPLCDHGDDVGKYFKNGWCGVYLCFVT